MTATRKRAGTAEARVIEALEHEIYLVIVGPGRPNHCPCASCVKDRKQAARRNKRTA